MKTEDPVPKPEQHHCPQCGSGFTVTVRIRFADGVRLAPDRWPWEPKVFGEAVRHARKAAGKRQSDLARQAGCTEVTIRNVEQGRKPEDRTRAAIVEVLAKFGQSYPPSQTHAKTLPTDTEKAP